MAQKHYRSRERGGSHKRERSDYYEHNREGDRALSRKRRYEDGQTTDHHYQDAHDFSDANSSRYDSHEHLHEEPKYFKKPRRHYSSSSGSESPIPSWDDEDRHYIIHLGESLIPRFKILSEMGEGTFGRVVECWDRELRKRVAVKIVRAIEKYRDAAMLEIEVLDTLKKHDPERAQPLIQLNDWFDFRDHVCMVFDKYGLSLYDFMRKNAFRPFLVPDVRKLGFQLLHSIDFLHSLTLIHTDLKPENILLVNSDYETVSVPPAAHSVSDFASRLRVPLSTDIKLIDFGSATFEHRYHTTVVSTRHYRAPEVIMGMGWSFPCDIWSIACILIQLYTGDALFQTHENREHLAMMEKVLGPFPEYFIDKADRHSMKYFNNGHVVFPAEEVTSPYEREKQMVYLKRMRRLEEYVAPEDNQFLDLLYKLFEYDPNKRITARDALNHPFFDSVRDLYKYKPVYHHKHGEK